MYRRWLYNRQRRHGWSRNGFGNSGAEVERITPREPHRACTVVVSVDVPSFARTMCTFMDWHVAFICGIHVFFHHSVALRSTRRSSVSSTNNTVGRGVLIHGAPPTRLISPAHTVYCCAEVPATHHRIKRRFAESRHNLIAEGVILLHSFDAVRMMRSKALATCTSSPVWFCPVVIPLGSSGICCSELSQPRSVRPFSSGTTTGWRETLRKTHSSDPLMGD